MKAQQQAQADVSSAAVCLLQHSLTLFFHYQANPAQQAAGFLKSFF
jgi:hypothetical protein